MNKAEVMLLWRTYEKSLTNKARNKTAENAFVSGLYKFYGKNRISPGSNNLVASRTKTRNNFQKDFHGLVELLKEPTANATALVGANKQARQTAFNYYHGLRNLTKTATNASTKLKAAPVNIDTLFKRLVTKAAEVKPARNRLGRPLGSRRYPPGYMQNFKLPKGLTMNNFKNKLKSMNTKWTSEKNVKRMVEATLLREYGPKNNSTFYAKYPNLATGPFRNIMDRATNTKKRFQPGSSRPTLTASNAQFQALKSLSPNGKTYYGNMPIWKGLTLAQVNNFTNLTPIQKNALKRMIRSVKLNNSEPNKVKVRVGRNREELTNNLMKIRNNKNLLEVIKKRVAKSREPKAGLMNNTSVKNNGGGSPPVAVPTYQDHLRNFGNY